VVPVYQEIDDAGVVTDGGADAIGA